MRSFVLGFCVFSFVFPSYAARVEIKDGHFYVDGQPFYVKAIAYGPWRPHQRPGTSYAGTNHRWTNMDFARIKAAHFNTVRTWEPLTTEELLLAKQNGLMVIQGLRLDPRQDFSKPYNEEAAAVIAQRAAEESRTADNVLGYLVMNRAAPDVVLEAGPEGVQRFFRRLKRMIQYVDQRPVAMDLWWPLAFLEEKDGEFAAFNDYAFWPPAIHYAMGQANAVRWIVDHHARNRPMIISETGGYGVSKTSWSVAGGYGGLTEYDQSLKDLDSLRATVEGHAEGSALVSWIDSWHYSGDADTHDDEPWEWTGILGIPTDSKKDRDGRPRVAYRDVLDYNQIIPTEPKANHFYKPLTKYPVEAFTAPPVASVRFNINDGEWTTLLGSEQGRFSGFFSLPKLARRRVRVSFQALDKDSTLLAQKDVPFVVALDPETVRVATRDGAKDKLSFQAIVRNGDNQPIAQRKVYYGCFYPVSFQEAKGVVTTDSQGFAVFNCPASTRAEDRYLYVAAGTDSPERVRAADLRIFQLGRR
jgi:hypothetical protein